MGHDRLLPVLARLDGLVQILHRGRVRAADIDEHLGLGGVLAGGGDKAHPAFAQGLADLELEQAELLLGPGEAHLDRLLADHLEVLVGLDLERDLLDARLHDKQRHRHGEILARSGHARERRQHGQGLAHEHRLVGGTVGAVATGHDHDAHRADVGRQLDLVSVPAFGLELEGAKEAHHRREAFLVLTDVFRLLAVVAATEREQALELTAVGTGDEVEQIPCGHTERLFLIEVPVQIRRLEPGEPEQPLVHHRHGVGHGATAGLRDIDGDGGLRLPLLGRLEHGLEPGVGIADLERDDAVQTYGPIVFLAGVRLDQRYADKHVRTHGRGDGHLEAGVGLLELDPALLNDARAALDGDQRASLGGLRELDLGDLADRVLGLVGEEAEHTGTGAAFLLRAPGPAGPVDVEHLAGAVGALQIAGADQVAAPARVLDLELPGPAAVDRGAVALHDHAAVAGAGIAGERLAGLVPPPLPIDLVERDLEVLQRDRLAVGAQAAQLHGVYRVGEQHAAGLVALGQLDADVVVIGRERQGLAAGTERPAALEHAAGEAGGEHAGSGLADAERLAEARAAIAVELALEQHLGLAAELARRIVEGEVGEALEPGRHRAQPHLDVRLEIGGGGAVQPLAEEAALERHLGLAQYRLVEIELDLQTIGHHRLDLESLAEGGAAENGLGRPVAGRGIVGGAQGEGVKAADRRGVSHALHALALGVVQLHGDRVMVGDHLVFVLQDKSEIDVVARTPHATLAVDLPLEAAADLLPADIEVADGQRRALTELEITPLPALLGKQVKRCGRQFDLADTLGVGVKRADHLVLEVQDRDLDAVHGRRGAQVRGHHEHPAALVALGEQADVGAEEIARVLHTLGILVVGVRAGILAIAQAAVGALTIIILVVFPTAGLLDLQVLVVDERLGFIGHGRLARAAIVRVRARDREREPEQPARILTQQLGGIEAVAIPLVGRGRGQRDGPAPEIATHTAKLLVAVELIGLQELADVVLINAKRRHPHRAHVHGLERDAQHLVVREDDALAGKADLWLLADEGGALLEPLRHTPALGIANTGLDGDGHTPL